MRPVFVLLLMGLFSNPLAARAFASQDPAAPTFPPVVPIIAPEIIMTDSTASPVLAQLEAAIKDLEMPSETDAPFRVVFYPSEPEAKVGNEAKPRSEAKQDEKTETQPQLEDEKTAENGAKNAEKITPEAIAKLAGAPAEAKIETRDLDEFFANAATSEDWMENEEKATAKRFAALLETLKKLLQKPQVIVWGDAKKEVAIIGEIEGGLAGILTIIVET